MLNTELFIYFTIQVTSYMQKTRIMTSKKTLHVKSGTSYNSVGVNDQAQIVAKNYQS